MKKQRANTELKNTKPQAENNYTQHVQIALLCIRANHHRCLGLRGGATDRPFTGLHRRVGPVHRGKTEGMEAKEVVARRERKSSECE